VLLYEEKVMTLPLVPFYFIRHGETEWNREGRIMGHQDIPLNERGIEQAYQAAPFLQGQGIQRIVSSPLHRAKQTALILASSLKIPLETHEDLKEVCWGTMEGQLKNKGDGSFERWIQGETPLGAESCAAFQRRVTTALSTFLNPNQTTLIVAHQGIYWVLRTILGYPESTSSNATPYVFRPPENPTLPWMICALDETS